MFSAFYRNYRLLIVSVLLIVVWGLSAFFTLPRLEDPELTSRSAIVSTFLPGADATRVEALVTEKIEAELAEIPEIETYESVSRAGSSIISIELFERITGAAVDRIWSEVRDKLDEAAVELPADATEPELEVTDVRAYASIVALNWTQDDTPSYAILQRSAERLQDILEAIPGTEEVELFGEFDEEITVAVDSERLATLDLTPQAVAAQIRQSDAKIGAGQLRGNSSDLLLEIDSELDTLARIRQIPIQTGDSGQFARVGDVATVKKGIADPPVELAIVGGKPAIALATFVETNYRLDIWAKQAENAFAQFRQELPRGLDLVEVLNQSRYVETRLQELIVNLTISALLTFGITLLMMGWRAAVAIGLALPLSTALVLGWMQLLGIPLHQMSVTGSIVALGLLVDTAIVVVDELGHRLDTGAAPVAALQETISHLGVPLLGSTLTTVLGFLPIALLPGGSGEFVGTIGTSVILAVTASLLLSMTIIPTVAARLHDRRPDQSDRRDRWLSYAWWRDGIRLPWLGRLFERSLRGILAWPLLGAALALVLPVIGFVGVSHLPEQFFPPTDRDQIQVELELPASASLQRTQNFTERARELVRAHPEAIDVQWFLGRNAPRFYYNLTGGRERYSNYAQGIVRLDGPSTPTLVRALQADLDAALPEARAVVRQLEQGPPFAAPVELRLFGPDLERLQALGEEARGALIAVPSVVHSRDSLSEVLPQLNWALSEVEARRAGLDYAEISTQLAGNLDGNLGGSILEDTEELPVRVRLADRSRLDAIASLDLVAGDRRIPLSALGEVSVEPEIATISRRNGQRFNLVQGYLQAGILPATALEQFQANLRDRGFQLPPGYRQEVGGEADEQASAVSGLLGAVPVLVVLMAATLILALDSFGLAGIIALVATGAIGLGFLAIGVFGYPFGFMGIVGTFGLVGVAVNDAVVVLAALKESPAASRGDRAAIAAVVLQSSRHVVATTLTTVAGFMPLILGGGGFWPPLAVAIAGGIGGATLLALYFVPATFLAFVRSRPSRQLPSLLVAPARERGV